MNPNDTINCFNNHMGIWAVEPEWLTQMAAAIKSGTVKEQKPETFSASTELATIASGKTALITVSGLMMKGFSKFGGGASTVHTRQQLSAAVKDSTIDSILMRWETPGGHSAGSMELADAIAAADKIKPVFSQVEDLCCSAGVWGASRSRMIFSNPMGIYGSIGTMTLVQDSSAAFEREGVKVHVISTGEFKGAGAPGTEVTEAQIEQVQKRVNDINQFFLNSVSKGRNMSAEDVAKVADGRTFIASEAVELGLIDGVQSIEETAAALREEVAKESRSRRIESVRSQMSEAQSSEQQPAAE